MLTKYTSLPFRITTGENTHKFWQGFDIAPDKTTIYVSGVYLLHIVTSF